MKKKINILSPGRFHVCDLARELDKQGFDVKFYSFVPSKRTEKFGLPKNVQFLFYPQFSLFLYFVNYFLKSRVS